MYVMNAVLVLGSTMHQILCLVEFIYNQKIFNIFSYKCFLTAIPDCVVVTRLTILRLLKETLMQKWET